jgi:uncharacterized protein (TIGR03067 family)
MRGIEAAIISMLALALCIGALWLARGPEPSDQAAMAGSWVPVFAERDGTRLSAEEIAGITLRVDFSGRAIVTRGDQVSFEGVLELDPTRNPKQFNAVQGGNGEGEVVTLGIYQVDADTLKLCSAAPGQATRPTEFAAKAGCGLFYRVFTRAGD